MKGKKYFISYQTLDKNNMNCGVGTSYGVMRKLTQKAIEGMELRILKDIKKDTTIVDKVIITNIIEIEEDL